jgi:hypothetical protein
VGQRAFARQYLCRRSKMPCGDHLRYAANPPCNGGDIHPRSEEIAYILYISHRTVRYHKYRIMEDLGLKNNTELVQYAIKHSIIPSR